MIRCVNLNHDHTTTVDAEGRVLDAPVPMTCNDCGLPTHYDDTPGVGEVYQHDDPDAPDCFLIPDGTIGTPCEWREVAQVQIRTKDLDWAQRNGLAREDEGEGYVRVTVTVPAVEPVTFGGRDMVRFDLRDVADVLPRDLARWAQVPASWVVG